MWFSKKQVAKSPDGTVEGLLAPTVTPQLTTKRLGDAAETAALHYLAKTGMRLVESNYRTPGRGGGEIDLIMRASDGTLVFVEVRKRSGQSHGGAGASISRIKQQRIIFAARQYLMRFASPPPCRFDVVLVQGPSGNNAVVQLEWLQAAFDAS